jgi:hypothetical protein
LLAGVQALIVSERVNVTSVFNERRPLAVSVWWTVNDFTGSIALGNYIAVAANRDGHIADFGHFEWLATGTVFGLNGLNFHAKTVPSCQALSKNTN